MSWIIKTTRTYSSIVKFRVRTFLFCLSLKTGILIAAIHTLLVGIALFLGLWMQPKTLTFDLMLIPHDVRLVSGLFGSPLIFLGGTLLMAYIKPKTGLLDGFIVNMQTLQFMFPMVIGFLYVRTYFHTENYYEKLYESTLKQRILDDRFVFKIFINFTLSLALVSYFAGFYYIAIVVSFKGEYLRTLLMKRKFSEATTSRHSTAGRSIS